MGSAGQLRDQVQRMLAELQTLGNPPDEVMAEVGVLEVVGGGLAGCMMQERQRTAQNLEGQFASPCFLLAPSIQENYWHNSHVPKSPSQAEHEPRSVPKRIQAHPSKLQ